MHTKNLVESLKKFGIKAIPYKRPPSGKDIFVIAIAPKGPEGTVQVNQGLAKVEIHGSKKHRQAVITVIEEPRVITRLVNSWTSQKEEPVGDRAKSILRGGFNIHIPGNVSWSYGAIKVTRRKLRPGSGNLGGWNVIGKVTAKAGRTTVNHFLVGVDESRNFIAPLKEKATSVEDAHRKLKPKMRAGALRQGEWFFEPILKDEAAKIEKLAEDGRNVKLLALEKSTHRLQSGMVVSVKGEGKGKARKPGTRTIYARGYVVDSRKGHHKSLFLPTWHKVVRNKEITYKRRQGPARRRSFD